MKLERLSGSKFGTMTNEQMSMIKGGDCITGGGSAKFDKESQSMKKIVFALSLLCSAVLFSCSKKDATEASKPALSTMSTVVTRYSKFSDWPKVSNGMLVFPDTNHLINYINFLDSVIDPHNYDSVYTDNGGEFDQDLLLQNVENTLGFTSIRSTSHANFLKLNDVGWDRPENAPEEHFIHSMDIKSILNTNMDVQIGTAIVHYINAHLCVNYDVSRTDLQSQYNRLPSTATLTDAINIDPMHLNSGVYWINDAGYKLIWDRASNKPTGGNYKIANFNYTAPDCANPHKLVFSGIELTVVVNTNGVWSYIPTKSKFMVSFDDGTTLGPIYSTISTGGYANVMLADFNHTFTTEGVHDVTLTAWNITNTTNVADIQEVHQVTVKGAGCRKGINKATDDQFQYLSGGIAFSGKASIEDWGQFFVQKTRVISETTSWVQSGTKWKEQKGVIWGNVAVGLLDKDCNYVRGTTGDCSGNKSKHILVHRTDDEYHWTRVDTEHGMYVNGTWNYLAKPLYACQ